MRILSLGAGVQSTTVILLAEHGEIPPLEGAIFADTGWEPPAVYDHLRFLEDTCKTPIYRVSAGSLRDDALSGQSSAWMPLYISENGRGGRGMLRRQCTKNYKILPIRRQLRALGGGSQKHVDLVIGISLDEAQRMRDSDRKYITHRYPLIDLRLTRYDCMRWLDDHGYPIPPKSSCIGCPYHDNAFWSEMKRSRPEEFANAVDFDERIRDFRTGYGQAYLSRNTVPLAEDDFKDPRA